MIDYIFGNIGRKMIVAKKVFCFTRFTVRNYLYQLIIQ